MSVSIVLPAYNAARTLSEALESVLAQTLTDWELVVVDDGSTDRTPEIAKGFAARDARIRLVQRQNGGEAAARNTGLEHIRFDWVLFLDSDDWISPDHLELLTAELGTRPELDAVVGGSVRVSTDGTQVRDDFASPPEGDLVPILASRAAFTIHSCIVRRSIVEAAGRFDTSFRKSEDWDLWQRVARSGARFGVVHKVVAYYRMSPGSATSNAEMMFSNGLRILQQARTSDPRVRTPAPAYREGLVADPVEGQVFYLLTWCAGRLLAAGQDARGLLDLARDYRWPRLHPLGIARCIFDGGMHSTGQPGSVWESLLARVLPQIQEYLVALEQQSLAEGLASSALAELKRMILERSPSWRSLIDEFDRSTSAQAARTSQLEERLRAVLAETDSSIARLEAEVESKEALIRKLEGELSDARRLSAERAQRLARLRQHKWILHGLDVGNLKQSDVGDPGLEHGLEQTVSEELCGAPCRLRVSKDSDARLLLEADPGTARIEITRAGMDEWSIQLDLEAGPVVAAALYALDFRIRADAPRTIGVGLSQAHDPWANLGFYEHLPVTPEWQVYRAEITASSDDPRARIHLDCGKDADAIEVADLSFEPVSANPTG